MASAKLIAKRASIKFGHVTSLAGHLAIVLVLVLVLALALALVLVLVLAFDYRLGH
jgi:hypothetical protein